MDDHDTIASDLDANAATVAATKSSSIEPGGAVGPSTRYKVDAVLGRGGMGEVVSARDEQIGRSVAIKRMRTASPSADTTARFLREAKIQGCLEHPAIVPVHELATDASGAPFFVMKQLAGTTLAEVLDKLAASDPETATRFTRTAMLRAFADVCLAIELAHTKGIVHRDLKPANIVLGGFGEVYVLDWGIAKVIGDPAGAFSEIETLGDGGTVEGAVLGTPGYMSPEQIQSDPSLDGRADVYALGCILFEILALAPLHPRGRPGLASALAGIDPKTAQRPDLPPELDQAWIRATASSRDARFSTARELGDHVQRFLDGDRDLVRRRDLARTALGEARAALARDPADSSGDAMRAAGRAVALDPEATEAAELLSNLMIRPPSAPPPEVEAELARADLEGQLATRKLTAIAGYGYLLFLPVMWWIGFSGWQAALIAAIALVMIGIGELVSPKNLTLMSTLAIAVHCTMIVIAARYASPFLLAPAMGVIVAMSNSTLTRFAGPITIAGAFAAAALGPFALEKLGFLSPTMTVSGNQLELAIAVDHLDPAALTFGLSLFVGGVIFFGAVLARRLVEQRRAALRQTELQSWRLRQLVTGRRNSQLDGVPVVA